ncbi:MAG: polysaccharide deacetylase family protein [Candidatus Fimenecus sp.]
MKKISKHTLFRVTIIILSVLLVAATASAVYFVVQDNKSKSQIESLNKKLADEKSSYDADMQSNSEAFESFENEKSSEAQSYEDRLSAESSANQSKVDELNKQIESLNKQLAAKRATSTTKRVDNQSVTPPTPPAPPSGKTVYLTFDDGPSQYTPEILNVLDRYGVKATFFVVNGRYNSVMKDIVNRGNAIGLHSYSHNYAGIYSSDSAFYSDLNKISAVVKEQTGVETKIMRFPGGSSNTVSKKYSPGIMSRLAKSVTENGYVYFDWNCANGDAAGANTVEKQLANCKSYPKSASNIVVLMHDNKSTTLAALPKIIEYYQSCGMSFGVLTTSTPPVHHGINN